MDPAVVMHLGALHPVEKVLTLVLAFGPFVALALVVVLRREADDATDREAEAARPADAVQPEDQRDR